ncbi:MAG: NAD-dependent deacylase [Flavobacteriales bacterium]|nr:NAD-dependent deacylase [Flavobacteriales bacterium]
MKKLVVLTGAGMSAESGIQTFRGNNGLWEGYDVMKVASPEGWREDKALVLEFYNQRRKNVLESKPNAGHFILKELEQFVEVWIITQNIDNLHERAGSSNIIHLHGEITKGRSTVDDRLVFELDKPTIELGDKCPKGSQVRPHIVWFGEQVPMIEPAVEIVGQADILLVIGTSMAVYPAAGLVQFAPAHCPIFLIDPDENHESTKQFKHIVAGASKGLEIFRDEFLGKFID